MNSIIVKRKPHECPLCGSVRVAEILYGLPAFDEKVERDLKDGKVILGGCCVAPDSPVWKCLDCDLDICRESGLYNPDDV